MASPDEIRKLEFAVREAQASDRRGERAKVQIHTPVGAIGLRGTTVWGGPIDKGYGVIVLNAEVTVTGRRGTVTLKQGQGTMLFGDGKPRRAAAWPAGRMKRAVASITFGNPPAQQ